MEKNTRKEVLIALVASVAGLILSLYSLVAIKDAGGFRLFLAVVGVGIFLLAAFAMASGGGSCGSNRRLSVHEGCRQGRRYRHTSLPAQPQVIFFIASSGSVCGN